MSKERVIALDIIIKEKWKEGGLPVRKASIHNSMGKKIIL